MQKMQQLMIDKDDEYRKGYDDRIKGIPFNENMSKDYINGWLNAQYLLWFNYLSEKNQLIKTSQYKRMVVT